MNELIFTLLYILLVICLVFPPTEFISAGLTIPALGSKYLGAEEIQFIKYHMRKTILTLFIYSIIPVSYIYLLSFFDYEENVIVLVTKSLFWKIFFSISLVLPIIAGAQIHKWILNNYENHPIVVNLKKFGNNNNDWEAIASDINAEFRRFDKICLHTSSLSKIIVTENWILKVMPFTIFIAHQSDTTLTVKEAKNYLISQENLSEVQFLTIEVKSSRTNVDPFTIRINATDFKDLQDRITRTITILPNVKFHRTVIEQFVDVFKEVIQQNPIYRTQQLYDQQCVGCLQATPAVKLRKLCTSSGPNNCTNCYCRPMWCLDCMAKWFASRQDNDQQSQWLASKCTCPLCRATFCVLDVCLVNNEENEQ